jgi:protein-tyrosine phosphatase
MSELTPAAGASIRITTVPNLRDLGGWTTPDGTVRRGLVYRSAEFSSLAGPDAEAFADLGIRTVFDMRTQDERTQQPNTVPDGTGYVVVDIFADRTGAAPAQLLAVLGDPAAAEALLGGGKAVTLFEGAYRELITLPSAVNGYREFFTDLADPSMVPAVFHCTTGKDRTGWGAAALLLLLGVSSDDVMEDYLLTNEQLLPSLQPILDRFAAAGGDPALLMPVLGVQREYLEAAMDEMTRTYGDVETYFVDGLGIDSETIAKLRSSLVEPAS